MKDLIKNILLEQSEMVPQESWHGTSADPTQKHAWNKQSITKAMFIKVVKLIVKYESKDNLISLTENDLNEWDRTFNFLEKYTKLIGVRKGSEGLSSKILYAALDNYDKIKDDTITLYDQLELRPLRKFSIPMYEDVQEYKTLYWTVKVNSFSENDAINNVMRDEDGEYGVWEWGVDDEESHEWETEDRGILEDTHITSEIVWQDTKSDETGQIVESKLKAGPEENDIISELEELLSNKTLTEKNVRNILTKYKSKSLTESWSTESTTKENSKAPELNKQPITIVEVKFMTKIKQKFDGSVITRWAAMTHYSLGDVQELKPFTRAFGVNDDMRLSQLINLLWDNMDVDDFSSFVGESAPKLQHILITKEYLEMVEAVNRATVSTWGVDYETYACDIHDNFWDWDPEINHLHDDSLDVVEGSQRYVNIAIDGNTVWDDGTMGDPENKDNEYDIDSLSCSKGLGGYPVR